MPSYVIGVDFGTESGRAVVIAIADGHELGSSVYAYANGVIDEALPAPDDDVRLAPEWALQDPDDYLRTFQQAVPAAIAAAGVEADDIIGTISVRMRSCGRNSVIVTRDKDLAQVLRRGDTFWDFAGRRRIAYEQVADVFGVRAEQLADFLALAGDSVDNIPGVPGVGAKTAAALLQRFDDLDAIYAELDQVLEVPVRGAARVRERLAAHRDDAYLARRLTRVHEEVPLDLPSTGLAVGTPDFDALEALFAAADFVTALRRRVRQLAPS